MTIVVLCGPPACGKTTLAEAVLSRFDDRGHDVETLHTDDIDRDPYDRMYERVAADGGDWILDGTFYDQAKRDRFRDLDAEVRVVWVDAARDSCIERNENRDDAVAPPAIYSLYAKFEDPDADLRIDTDELAPEAAADRLESALLEWLAA